MDPRSFFRRYAEDRRADAIPSFVREDFPHLVRYTPLTSGSDGMVMFAVLNDDRADEQILEQVAHFDGLALDFEWKVYAFDRPGDLRERLASHDFTAEDEETFMVCERLSTVPTSPPPGCELRRIVDATGIDDVMRVQHAVWPDAEWLRASLLERLHAADGTVAIWCAYRRGRPVGTGWSDYPPGSRFPELHGGSVVPEARGLGIYAALFHARLADAAQRGHEQVCVDASSMSRPLLERVGFVPVCTTVPMKHRARTTGSSCEPPGSGEADVVRARAA